jgi:hypothetical protein
LKVPATAVVNCYKVTKHFEPIGEAGFSFGDVGAYKSLARVERGFRSLKTVDVHLRPILHWTTPRVRAHVLLCMLAYHVERHMRSRLAPMLYEETDHKVVAAAMRTSIVAKAEGSETARRKQTTGLTDDGLPVYSFQSLLAYLATYARIQATTALCVADCQDRSRSVRSGRPVTVASVGHFRTEASNFPRTFLPPRQSAPAAKHGRPARPSVPVGAK